MRHEEYLHQIHSFYEDNLFIPPHSEKKIDILLQPEQFYKSIMSQSEDKAKSLHKHLTLLLESDFTSSDPEARAQLSNSYWQFLESIISHTPSLNEISVKLLLRYGVIVSSAISREILQIITENDIYAPPKVSIYYLDEWFDGVMKGDISQSLLGTMQETTREMLALNEKQKINQIQKIRDSSLHKAQTISQENKELLQKILSVGNSLQSSMEENEFGYTFPIPEHAMAELFSCIQTIQTIRVNNKQLQETQSTIERYTQDIEYTLDSVYEQPSPEEDDADNNNQEVNAKIIYEELNSIKQMFKMSVGKTGNHIPLLFKKFFSFNIHNLGTREVVLKHIQEIETIDYSIFFRNIKRTKVRMFPQILLLPCYGTKGVCWEPFNFYNRNASSAKIIIPMYSSKLFYCICYAIGDYRWQISKEEAGHRWTLEGLTGLYYQWSEDNKVKGSLKENFIADYIQWIQWESKGISKLHKDIRSMFWKHIPFPNELQKELKSRSGTFRKLM